MTTRNRFLLSILLCLFAFSPSLVHAQTAAVAEGKPAAKNKALWTVLSEGGAIMIPIGLVSVGMCSLIALGFITLRKKKLVPDVHVEALRKFFMEGDYQAAVAFCRANPGFFADTV